LKNYRCWTLYLQFFIHLLNILVVYLSCDCFIRRQQEIFDNSTKLSIKLSVNEAVTSAYVLGTSSLSNHLTELFQLLYKTNFSAQVTILSRKHTFCSVWHVKNMRLSDPVYFIRLIYSEPIFPFFALSQWYVGVVKQWDDKYITFLKGLVKFNTYLLQLKFWKLRCQQWMLAYQAVCSGEISLRK